MSNLETSTTTPIAKTKYAKRSDDGGHPHTEFANHLRSLMREKHISASDLARGVWGTLTDPRGYKVARNRDRIGHYLSGRSYPEKENRAKIAKVLGVDAEVLEKYQPVPAVREADPGPKDIRTVYFTDGPNAGAGCLSLSKVMLSPKSITLIMEVISKDPIHKALIKKSTAL